MTEADWTAGKNPELMLASLRGRLSRRKLRHFACACCRRIRHLLTDERSQVAVDMAERHADGLVDDQQLVSAEAMAEQAFQAIPWESNGMAGALKLAASAAWAVTATKLEETTFEGEPLAGFAINAALQAGIAADVPELESAMQTALLRDILGNPFRPVTFDRAWRTATVASMAEVIYADRAFELLPVLADALEDAGCTSREILDHCRGPGPHVRGCWVVDLILGKE